MYVGYINIAYMFKKYIFLNIYNKLNLLLTIIGKTYDKINNNRNSSNIFWFITQIILIEWYMLMKLITQSFAEKN